MSSTDTTRETAADTTTGAIVSVVDAAANPSGTARKAGRRLARKGAPVNTRLRRSATRTGNEVTAAAEDVISGNLAERVALQGIRILKNRARRRDMVGDVLHQGLRAVSVALDGTARELGKFQEATRPPVRSGESRGAAARRSPANQARRTSTTATKRAGSTARRARTSTRTAVRRAS